jgi:sulfite reductase alpha subunit-like flavoprotein
MLCRTKLESFLSSGVLTHLHVSFSRHQSDVGGEQQPSYVQDNMIIHWEELARWIMEDNASVFVCG